MHTLPWVHAANNWSLLGSLPQSDAFGLEVDVRLFADHAFLSHDPIVDEESARQSVSFADFCAHLRSIHLSNLRVCKLDFKDFSASVVALQCEELWQLLAEMPSMCLWLNADIIRGPGGATPSFPSPKEVIAQWVDAPRIHTTLHVGLSLGWTTGGSNLSYSLADVEEMSRQISDLQRMIRPTWSITFPVRLSFVRECSSKELDAFHRLLDEASQNRQRSVTLTFWRARTEVVTDDDMEWVEKHFRGSYVDRD